MSERCNNCGAEFYAGQQFCRRCGAPVRFDEAGEAPTRMLGGGGRATGGAYDPELTAPFGSGASTDPSMRPPPTAPQAPFVGFNPTRPLAPAAARKERTRWLLPFALGVALAGLGALLVYRHSARQTTTAKRPAEMKKVVVTAPPMPPEAVEALKQATEHAGRDWAEFASLAPMDEAGAVTGGDETVITKSYPLEADGSFLVRSAKGDVTVEGWDEETAEVRVRKRGGSAEERRGTPVMFGMKGERLVLASAAGQRGPVEVIYEIKVPRSLRQLEISAEESDVRLEGVSGTVVVDVKQGALEFVDVTGTARGKLIKGDTKVSYKSGPPDGTQEFSVVRGNVEVDLAEGMDADVKAETLDGDVAADAALGLKVVKRAAGMHALGRLGDGSEPLLIKVVNGDIKLRK